MYPSQFIHYEQDNIWT